MGAAVNGLAYHGGFIPFGATFLVFSDYMRPPIRLSALAELRSIFVFTHDSIGLGEDGPTPPAGRAASGAARDPGPARHPSRRRQRDARRLAGRDRDARSPDGAGADAPEGADARSRAATRRPRGCAAAPTSSTASRRRRRARRHPDRDRLGGVAHRRRRRDAARASGIRRAPGVDAVLAAVRGAERRDYRDEVLPPAVDGAGRGRGRALARLGPLRRRRDGAIVGVDRFGASAPGETVMREYGFTPEHVADTARAVVR